MQGNPRQSGILRHTIVDSGFLQLSVELEFQILKNKFLGFLNSDYLKWGEKQSRTKKRLPGKRRDIDRKKSLRGSPGCNFPYLRTFFIFLLYSSSHAFVLMARIPDTTWLINEMRRSETDAVRRRSTAPPWDNPLKHGRRIHKKINPTITCHPMK